MTPERLAIAALFLTLLGIVYRGGALAGRIDAGLAELRAIIVELKAGITAQQKTESRVAVLETEMVQVKTTTIAQSSQLYNVVKKLGMHSGELRAVRQSSHDIDSDPPKD